MAPPTPSVCSQPARFSTAALLLTSLCALLGSGCDAFLGERDGLDGLRGESSERAVAGVLSETLDRCEELGAGIHPGPAPIRRLTRDEYDATVGDLLGTAQAPAREFPPEARALGFYGIAAAQTVTSLLAENYQDAAKALAEEAAGSMEGLAGCDPLADACVDDFIREFGGQSYRRPLSEAEAARLKAVFEWGRDNQSLQDGLEMVLEVLLQSPDFLYRPEFGVEEVEAGIVRLSSRELATRLSYFLLGSLPDAELQEAAAADQLSTAAGVRAQAERLLETERAKEQLLRFYSQWLDLSAVEHIERDPSLYEGWTSETAHLMRQETEAFVDYVLFEDDASLQTLMTAEYTVVNAELAEFYGLSAPEGEGFQRVPTTAGQGRGLLTQGGLLAHHAQSLQTSPVHRGKFIRESILCQLLAPPPDDLVIEPPDLDPTLTTRERFAQHSEDAACAGCHELMDPVGLGFEHFDSVGRWRDEENGLPIDASGHLIESDVSGAFYGADELAQKLGQSDVVASCMVRNWIRFTHGRSETPEDACTLVQIGGAFASEGYDLRSLLVHLTQSEAFLYRKVVAP